MSRGGEVRYLARLITWRSLGRSQPPQPIQSSSSAGRAGPLQGHGRRFEPSLDYHLMNKGLTYLLLSAKGRPAVLHTADREFKSPREHQMNTGRRHTVSTKEEARRLRIDSGWSMKRIARHLKVSLCSVSLWTRGMRANNAQVDLTIPLNLRRAGNSRHRGAIALKNSAQQEAADMWEKLYKDSRFIAGISIYAGEGAKTQNALSMSNSDADIIICWVCWCRIFFSELPLRARINIHDCANVKDARAYWASVLGSSIPLAEKVTVVVSSASKRKRSTRRLPYGTITVGGGAGATRAHHMMMTWLRLLPSIF